jgi:hypothetical protein
MQVRTIPRGKIDVTVVGYGGAPIGNIFRPISAADAQAQIEAAWEAGVRTFDTAPMYGHGLSEHRLGHALLEHSREDYVLSTKVGRTLVPAPRGTFDTGVWVDVPPLRADFDYSYDAVLRQVEDSLQRMCQDRFDMLFVHDIDVYTHGDAQPQRFEEALAGAFPALLRLRDEGVVRAIGVGVNEADVCQAVVERVDIDCLLLAGRYHPARAGAGADAVSAMPGPGHRGPAGRGLQLRDPRDGSDPGREVQLRPGTRRRRRPRPAARSSVPGPRRAATGGRDRVRPGAPGGQAGRSRRPDARPAGPQPRLAQRRHPGRALVRLP